MSLLDDARRLASDPPISDDAECVYCGVYHENGHISGCAWLAMPRIIEALEAAQAVVDDYKPQRTWADVMWRLAAALKDPA